MNKLDLSFTVTTEQTARMLDEWIWEYLFNGLITDKDLLSNDLKFSNGEWNKQDIQERWEDETSYAGNCYPLLQEFVENITPELSEKCLLYIYSKLDEIWDDKKRMYYD